MNKRVVWSAALAVVLKLGGPVLAQDACRAIEIQPIQGDDQMFVSGMNNWGQVVGFSFGEGAASGFVWHRGRSRALQSLIPGEHTLPYAINDLGQIVGEAGDVGGFQAVVWTLSGVRRLPGQLGDRPEAINAQGVIGGSRGANCILWRNAREEPIVLGSLGGSMCSVRGINERGEVVGSSTTPSGHVHGFIWHDGVLTDVAPIDLPDIIEPRSSSLSAINEGGLAVGFTGPYLDVMTYRRATGARRVTSYLSISATAVNDWGKIFAVRETDEHLILMNESGAADDEGPLTGGVNGQQLFGNNLLQVAWQGENLKGYFCQLDWW